MEGYIEEVLKRMKELLLQIWTGLTMLHHFTLIKEVLLEASGSLIEILYQQPPTIGAFACGFSLSALPR